MGDKGVAKRRVEVPFAKYDAVGNDFIVCDLFEMALSWSRWRRQGPEWKVRPISVDVRRIARSICDRHAGVGADGLLLVQPPEDKKDDARMRVYNADGSEAEMSGNGIRCAAAYLVEHGQGAGGQRSAKLAGRPSSSRALRIETGAGVKSVGVVEAKEGRWVFRVGMGKPILAAEKIPFKATGASTRIVGYPLPIASGTIQVTVTSMGNPHCSVLVDDFDTLDWPALGREIESHERFPNRTNVEFVKVLSKREIDVRFWERGVGRTQSSGTGSCAALVASILNRRTGRKVCVRTLAGNLEVVWPAQGEVTLTGAVELVARGTYYCRI